MIKATTDPATEPTGREATMPTTGPTMTSPAAKDDASRPDVLDLLVIGDAGALGEAPGMFGDLGAIVRRVASGREALELLATPQSSGVQSGL